MGMEWTLVCTTCKQHAWLGSVKPMKWEGFQLGNRFAAELFALHASDGTRECCELLVFNDACFTDVPWADPEFDEFPPGWEAWKRDLRCFEFGNSVLPYWSDEGQGMVCGQCRRTLRSEENPGAPEALVVSSSLWFCDSDCRDAFAGKDQRVWRQFVAPPSDTVLEVGCVPCRQGVGLGQLDPEAHDGFEESAQLFAEWLSFHVYRPDEAAPPCSLAACVLSPDEPRAKPWGTTHDLAALSRRGFSHR